METRTAQLRIKPKNAITPYGGYGTVFYETPSRARFLIDAGIAELVNAGPAEQPQAGPSETKPAEPLEKKSFAAIPDGPSIASAESSEPGQAALSSASAPGLVSAQRSAPLSRPRGRSRKST